MRHNNSILKLFFSALMLLILLAACSGGGNRIATKYYLIDPIESGALNFISEKNIMQHVAP